MYNLRNIDSSNNKIRFHMIGIGGIGMSGIAEILNNLGYQVQGSDIAKSDNTERLSKLGIKIFIGHHPNNIDSADYVVVSTAIKSTNEEYQEALKLKLPIINRGEMLAEIMRLKKCISISGSHGKTTTTSMVASVLESAGLAPTVINGGIINTKSTNAYIGEGEFLVAEADESDATFIRLPSTIAIITNIDPEHLDYYKTFENLYEAFKIFVKNLPFYGFAVICADHPVTSKLINDLVERKIITYGIKNEDVNIRAYNIKMDLSGSKFDVKVKLPHNNISYIIENVTLSIPGEHNVLNSLAAIAVGAELDFGAVSINQGLRAFKGVKRRFSIVANLYNILFVDDYAHHPAEIRATLATAKISLKSKDSKIITIFQPHKYSRLFDLFAEFTESFDNADHIIITPLYAAGETKIEDYDSDKLSNSLREKYKNKTVDLIESKDEIPAIVGKYAKEGDLVLFMGAGNISKWANEFPEYVTKQNFTNIN